MTLSSSDSLSLQSHLFGNELVDNDMEQGTVLKSPDIYLTEIPEGSCRFLMEHWAGAEKAKQI